jgi:fumarate hydratase, class I
MGQATIDDMLDFGPPEDYERLELPGPSREGGLLLFPASSLELLSERAFSDIAFKLPREQAAAFGALAAGGAAAFGAIAAGAAAAGGAAAEGPMAAPPSEADRFVASELLRNAAIAAEGILPLCQDTGTAVVYGWKGSALRIVADEGAAEKGASELSDE